MSEMAEQVDLFAGTDPQRDGSRSASAAVGPGPRLTAMPASGDPGSAVVDPEDSGTEILSRLGLASAEGLRVWQRDALIRFGRAGLPEDFLVHATPGAGKTRFAGTLAAALRRSRRVDRVIVVTPTDHLRRQWATALRGVGLDLDPNASNAVTKLRPDADGCVVTYAQVAAKPAVHRGRTAARRTLVLLDEIHHCGDAATWGQAVYEAFTPARHRVGLTGTPFRSAVGERIPFVRYVDGEEDNEVVCEPDVTYGYREALADGVVRPVVFAAYSGVTRWSVDDGEVSEEKSAALGEAGLSRKDEDAAWRTALDPRGQWVRHVIAAMDDRISYLREHGMPRAAGLILASDQETARAYASLAEAELGHEPVVILSDDPVANRRIADFDAGDQRLAVAVRMISEGVDIPRVAVVAYLSRASRELIWQQSVGRALRKSHPSAAHEVATVFLPAVRPLMDLAARMEAERNHVVVIRTAEEEGEVDVLEPAGDGVGLGARFTALAAEAQFAHLVHSGRAITPGQPGPPPPLDEADEEFLGLPGLLSPEETAALLARRDAELRRAKAPGTGAGVPERPSPRPDTEHDALDLRREVNRLVGQVAGRSGRSHQQVHVDLRKAVPGPPSAQAPVEVLLDRRDHLLAELL